MCTVQFDFDNSTTYIVIRIIIYRNGNLKLLFIVTIQYSNLWGLDVWNNAEVFSKKNVIISNWWTFLII